MRSHLAAVAVLLTLAATPVPSPRLAIHIGRTSLDLLDTLAIGVVLDNPGSAPTTLRFERPQEYTITVRRAGRLIWTSAPKPAAKVAAYPVHTREVLPGAQTLATYAWNEIAADGSSPMPGEYLIRVRLGAIGSPLVATTRVRFVDPTPIAALATLHLGDEITLAGRLDAAHLILRDSTGSTTLPRRIAAAPSSGIIVVRGYIAALRDGTRYLAVTRWAREQ